jgi:hypothetical protein
MLCVSGVAAEGPSGGGRHIYERRGRPFGDAGATNVVPEAYNRPDVFSLRVDRSVKPQVAFDDGVTAEALAIPDNLEL